ncbi:MAG TPA: ATP-binding cassette domain-containing protein [Solirubrobacteraceae bacterium]|nr:ATP-binding cassette domain-containing protein [Solirubrobacteraceae bacterium]
MSDAAPAAASETVPARVGAEVDPAEADPAGSEGTQPVRARGLVKRYKEVLAVDHIDLNVRTGDVYGFLGPNGAGKTTTLRMALGLITPTEGTVELFGRDPMRQGARALEGVAGFVEAPRFYPYLTGRKNLELLAALDGDGAKERIEEVLEVVELTARAKHRVGGYSHGMRQRLGIAAALLRRPRLLILDEPATGLDPAGMRDMRELIRRLAGEGITVLLSSHQLPEVQELCDRVAIVDKGRVVYEGALSDLRRQGGAGYRLRTSDDARALKLAGSQPGIEGASAADGYVRLQAEERQVGEFSLALGREGVAILALTPELATLEDLFFSLTEGPTTPSGNGSSQEVA